MMDLFFKKEKRKTLHVVARPNPGLWRGWCLSLHCRHWAAQSYHFPSVPGILIYLVPALLSY